MMNDETLYKVVCEDGRAYDNAIGEPMWPLPAGDGEPGEWLTVQGKLTPYGNGLRLRTEAGLVACLGPTIWIAECQGQVLRASDGAVMTRKARLIGRLKTWDERTARLFTVDCTERALLLVARPKLDSLSWDAVRAARDYAYGWVDAALEVARRDAEADVKLEPDMAKGSGATARRTDPRVTCAFWAAVGDAVWNAAWVTAAAVSERASVGIPRYAAFDAERAWQTKRLMTYLHRRGPRRAHKPLDWNAAKKAAWSADRDWYARRLMTALGFESPNRKSMGATGR